MIKMDEEDKEENCKKGHNRETLVVKEDNLSNETMKDAVAPEATT
jgi:hypothetical protein